MKKTHRIASFLLSAAITMPSLPLTAMAGETILSSAGDVNNDGVTNTADAEILSGYFAGHPGSADKIPDWDAADVNRDGQVTRADAMYLARHADGWDGYPVSGIFYTVTFDANAPDAEGLPEAQTVGGGGSAEMPVPPTRDGHQFLGWYRDADETDWSNTFRFAGTPIREDITLYALWVNTETDRDGDGLSDDIEAHLGTDPETSDSDGDGLSDRQETETFGTDPLSGDTDGDGIRDTDEDFDGDGLSTREELLLGLDPSLQDTDRDGLNDSLEQTLGTDPLDADTDGDGASDGLEVYYDANPLETGRSYTDSASSQSLSDTNPVAAGVTAEVPEESLGTVSVIPAPASAGLSRTIAGYLGNAYEISAAGGIHSAALTFTYDSALIPEDGSFLPAIYRFDPVTQTLTELPDQFAEETCVKAAVSDWGIYLLLDKAAYDASSAPSGADGISVYGARAVPADDNDDDIDDRYNAGLYDGSIRLLSNTSAPFIGINFDGSEGVSPSDYDGDGLTNGEEIEILEINGTPWIIMHSDPLFADSDGDGMEDKYEMLRGTERMLHTYNSLGLEGLRDSTYYNSYDIACQINEKWDVGAYVDFFSSVGALTTGTSKQEIYRREWLEYFDRYAEETLANAKEIRVHYSVSNSLRDLVDQMNKNMADIADITEHAGQFIALNEAKKNYIEMANAWDACLGKANEKALKQAWWDNHLTPYCDSITRIREYDLPVTLSINLEYYQSQISDRFKTMVTSHEIDYYDIITTGLGQGIELYTLHETYAELNANMEMFQINSNIFYELMCAEDKDIAAAAESIYYAMLSERGNFGELYEDAVLSETVSCLISLAWDAIVSLVSGSPYVWAVRFVTSQIISQGVKKATQQNQIVAEVNLAHAVNRILDRLLLPDHSLQNNSTIYQTDYLLTNLAQIRLKGEFAYGVYTGNSKNVQEAYDWVLQSADYLNLILSDALLYDTNALRLKPNVVCYVYAYDVDTYNEILTRSYCSDAVVSVDGVPKKCFAFRSGSAICYQLYVEPDEEHTITVESVSGDYHPSTQYHVKADGSDPLRLDFHLFGKDIYTDPWIDAGIAFQDVTLEVVDTAGNPIPNAEVFFRYGINNTEEGSLIYGKVNSEGIRTMSDLTADHYTVTISAENYETAYLNWLVTGFVSDKYTSYVEFPEKTKTVQLKAVRKHDMELLILDQTTVRPLDQITVSVPALSQSAVTVSGRVTFPDVPVGYYEAVLSGRNYPPQTRSFVSLGQSTTMLLISADPSVTCTFTGQVTETDLTTPIADADIYIVDRNDPTNIPGTAKTAADGTFSVSGIPVGNYSLILSKSLYNWKSYQVSYAPDDPTDTKDFGILPLAKAYAFAVTRTEADGTNTDILAASPLLLPVGASSQVWTVSSPADWKVRTNGTWFTVDKTGGRAGNTDLTLTVPDAADRSRTGSLLFESASRLYPVALQHLPGSVSGTVTDGTLPVAGVSVKVYDSAGAAAGQTVTGAAGEYSVPLPAGTYQFVFTHNDYLTETRNVTAPGTDITEPPVTLTLRPKPIASPSGTVYLLPAVTAASGVTVDITDAGGTSVAALTTDRYGGYAADFYAPGDYTFVYHLDGYTDVIKTVTVTASTLRLPDVYLLPDTFVPWSGSIADSFAGGSGTADDPYRIETVPQLAFFAQSVNAGNSYSNLFVALANSLIVNAPSAAARSVPVNWTSIGTGTAFAGTFCGNGNLIYGLYQQTTDSDTYAGLFGTLSGTVTDLILADCRISAPASQSSYNYAGGIAGYSSGSIRNCSVSGSVQGYSGGGIAGSGTTFSGCSAHADVYGVSCAGGIAGIAETILNCYNTGSISGGYQIGGLAGTAASVLQSYSTGTVTGSSGASADALTGSYGQYGYGGTAASYYLDSAAAATVNSGTALTAEQFADAASFEGFDFKNIWTFPYDGSYPYPQLITKRMGGENAQIWDGTSASGFAGGSGRKDDPYRIETAAQLAFFRDKINEGRYNYEDVHVELCADITLNDTDAEYWTNTAVPWKSIGTEYYKSFCGIFDGNGHTVRGLYQNGDSSSGLFGYLRGTVMNLNVEDSFFTGSSYASGGIASLLKGTVKNCTFRGTVIGPGLGIGGIVGYSQGIIENCRNDGTVVCGGGIVGLAEISEITDCVNTGSVYAGGGIAYENRSMIYRCSNSGTVTGTDNAGGIAAENAGEIIGCTNTGAVSAEQAAGGIAGACTEEDVLVDQCRNSGSVTGVSYAGGISAGGGAILNCFNTGSVSAVNPLRDDYAYAGGIAADNAAPVNCYNTGTVSASASYAYTGGITGSGACVSSYYLDTCGAAGSGTSVTADEMKRQETFEGFDFRNVWTMTGGDLPQFRLHQPSGGTSAVWDGSIASSYGGGSGTEQDPYLINDASQLAYLAYNVNDLKNYYAGSCFRLTADIVLNDVSVENWINSAIEWTPIGTYVLHGFEGTFDGGGHEILGLYVLRREHGGLFGTLNGTVRNLTVGEGYVCSSNRTGAVAGSGGTIENCTGRADIYGAYQTGGIAGCGSVITSCRNLGTVCGGEETGGITGCVTGYGGGIITSCLNEGTVLSGTCGGGIAGKMHASNSSGDSGPGIRKCSSSGPVYGIGNTGGIVGQVSLNGDTSGKYWPVVADSYNTGTVSSDTNTAGIVGYATYINLSCSYNAGTIIGRYKKGAVIGLQYGGSASIKNVYYLSTCGAAGTGTSMTDEAMRDASLFTGFDFTGTWAMYETSDYKYPMLKSLAEGN